MIKTILHSGLWLVLGSGLLAGQSALPELDLLAEQGDPMAAAEGYQAAAMSATSALDQAFYWDAAGSYFRAAEAAEAALEAFANNFDVATGTRQLDSLCARALHLSGVISMNGGDPETGYQLFLKAVPIRQSLHPEGHEDLLRSTRNLAVYHLEYAPTIDSAQVYIEQAMDILDKLPEVDPNLQLYTAVMRTKIYSRLQDRRSTRDAAELTDYILQTNADYDPVDKAFTFYDLGRFCQEVDDYSKVYDYSRLADQHFQEQGMPDWAANAREMRAAALQEEGEQEEALQIYLEAREVFISYEDVYSLPYNHYNVSLIKLDRGQLEESATEVEQAIFYAEMLEDTATLALFTHALAAVKTELGQLEESQALFEQAAGFYLGNTQIKSVEDIQLVPRDYLEPMANLLEDRSELHIANERLDLALQDLDLVFALQDRIRTELPNAESQQYISEHIRPFFQRAIHLRYLLHQEDGNEAHLWEALSLSERAKAFSLLQARQSAQRERPARERELVRRITELERLSIEDDSYLNLLASARLELQRLQGLKSGELTIEAKNLEAEDIRSFLRLREDALLEYALGEEHSYWFYVSSAGVLEMHAIDLSQAALSQQLDELRQALRQSAFAGPDLRSDAQKAFDLTYQRLAITLGEKLLPKQALGNRLIIIPDGILGYLPFGALLTGQSGETALPAEVQRTSLEGMPIKYQELPYLARDRELYFGYSMAYLIEVVNEERSELGRGVLALAPTFNGELATDQLASSLRSVETRGDRALPGLLPLLHNEEEVTSIAALFKGATTTLIGSEASRERFMELAADYQIIHLSSHALVNPKQAGLSFVAFSQQTDSLEDEEILYLLDLGGLSLNADLAVLSACETGLGRVSEGEGVLSMARAFSLSGAASTLTTLWKVDDAATKELMVAFYEALATGTDKAAALAQAQQQALEGDYAHPYYWSALSLYGDAGVLTIRPRSSGKSWWMILGAVGVVLLAFAGFKLAGKKQNDN